MNNIMIRRLVYSLKRQWGSDFQYVTLLKSEVDELTGNRTIDKKYYVISGVLLPQTQLRKFIQDIGYLAANKNFTYGGLNDINRITFIFNRFDLPLDFDINLDGYIVHGHKRYERVEFVDLYGEAYMLIAQGVEGSRPYSKIDKSTFNNLQIQQRIVYEIN